MRLFAYGGSVRGEAMEFRSPAGDEVLVRVGRCGVCRSDLSVRSGEFDLGGGERLDVRSGRSLPFVLGHEISGTIEATGSDVDSEGLDFSATYAVYPWIGCGSCGSCARGDEGLCGSPRHLGINVDGGFASHVMVPHRRYLLPIGGLDPSSAACAMCSGVTAWSALGKLSRVATDESSVLIVGLGGVGMSATRLARRRLGSETVIGVDPDSAKRRAALDLGADDVVDPSDSEAMRRLRSRHGLFRRVADFVGSSASLAFSVGAAGKGGSVISAGLTGGGFSFPVPMFALRSVSVIGSFVGSLDEARETLAAFSETGDGIPIEERSLDEAQEALDDLSAGRIVGRRVLVP